MKMIAGTICVIMVTFGLPLISNSASIPLWGIKYPHKDTENQDKPLKYVFPSHDLPPESNMLTGENDEEDKTGGVNIKYRSSLLNRLGNQGIHRSDSMPAHAGLKHQEASFIINNHKEVLTTNILPTPYNTASGKLPAASSQNYLKLQGSQIDLAQSAALNQESSEKGGVTTKSAPSMTKMVVILVSTVATIFGMSMLVAIFQCCCRKKGSNRGSKVPDTDPKDSCEGSTKPDSPAEKNEEEIKEEGENGEDVEDQENKAHQEIRESSEEAEDVNVRNRVKKFEIKKDNSEKSSPDSTQHVAKKRPESEAFKMFENKGILIGMGRAPKLQVPKEEEEEESPTPEQSPEKSEPKKSQLLLPHNPDVVIASEDEEDDDFNVIKRDQSILKSFTRAPPPKNRNRSSQALGYRKKPRSKDNQSEEKSEDEMPTTPVIKPKQPENDKTNDTETKEKIETEVKPSEPTEKMTEPVKNTLSPGEPPVKKASSIEQLVKSLHSSTDIETTEDKSPPPEADDDIDTSGNIFLHIDPTAKRVSPSVSPPHSPKENKPIVIPPNVSPKPSPRASPKPVRSDDLMKDLSARIKKQSPTESVNETEDRDS